MAKARDFKFCTLVGHWDGEWGRLRDGCITWGRAVLGVNCGQHIVTNGHGHILLKCLQIIDNIPETVHDRDVVTGH